MQLFWEKGYHATSLKDLEAALSMKPGSIYAAFTSKENLYLESLERYFLQGRETVETLLAEAPSPMGALADHLRHYVVPQARLGRGRSCMIVKTLIDATTRDQAIARRAGVYLDAMRDAFAEGFARAIRLKELPEHADPDRLARRYQANIAALRIEVHRGAAQVHLEAMADDMVNELNRLCIRDQIG